MIQTFVSKAEIAKRLNYTVREIDGLVSQRHISHHLDVEVAYKKIRGRDVQILVSKPGNMLFPLEEVLKKIVPRKATPAPKPKRVAKSKEESKEEVTEEKAPAKKEEKKTPF